MQLQYLEENIFKACHKMKSFSQIILFCQRYNKVNKIWFFSTLSGFPRLSEVPLSETIASVISLINYDKVFAICPRSWENEYTVTWVTTPFASQVVSNSLLSGDLIDSLASRSLKIIFDVRSLCDFGGAGRRYHDSCAKIWVMLL